MCRVICEDERTGMLPISLDRGKEKKIEVAWARQQNDTDVHHNYPSKEWPCGGPPPEKGGDDRKRCGGDPWRRNEGSQAKLRPVPTDEPE